MSPHPANVSSSLQLHGAAWRRGSRSTGMNNCVETAQVNGGLLAVRDSKRVSRPALLFGTDAWSRFVGAVRTATL
ncbi:DUF397 domain-containing protein [Streptomyces sp. NPDC091272]|uniref:DUF397 domain-containing protein n=1 Tax=Streptomyces sp. NPDC091272 TaxID=3365981 RepID=UPI00380268A8